MDDLYGSWGRDQIIGIRWQSVRSNGTSKIPSFEQSEVIWYVFQNSDSKITYRTSPPGLRNSCQRTSGPGALCTHTRLLRYARVAPSLRPGKRREL